MTNLALASPFSAQDVEVGLASFFWNDKTVGSLVRSFVYIDAGDLEFTPVDGRHQASIELHGVVFGDNGAIDISKLQHIRETMFKEATVSPWRQGDVVMLDNVLVCHGRMPYSGPRKILLAMTGN